MNLKEYLNMKLTQKTLFFFLWKYFNDYESKKFVAAHKLHEWIEFVWNQSREELDIQDFDTKILSLLMIRFPEHFRLFQNQFIFVNGTEIDIPSSVIVCKAVYTMLDKGKDTEEVPDSIRNAVYKGNKFIWNFTLTDYQFKLIGTDHQIILE